jgi:hypothetical protein
MIARASFETAIAQATSAIPNENPTPTYAIRG